MHSMRISNVQAKPRLARYLDDLIIPNTKNLVFRCPVFKDSQWNTLFTIYANLVNFEVYLEVPVS